ncbi:MAG: alpha/beta hydrolase [Bacteroidia bacterium]
MKNKVLMAAVWFVAATACSYLPEEPPSINEFYKLTETQDYILIEPETESNETGLLFVPGGLVDAHAYIKSFDRFVVDHKMKVIILKVRSNLAIFNSKLAKRVRKEFEDTKWYIGGHSLGGVVAAMSVGNEPDKYEGLFMMGSYSITNLSDWNQPVFSFIAELDGLSDLVTFEENEANLPEGVYINSPYMLGLGDTHKKTVYYTILGGNHAQFGSYGPQEGDNDANISADYQQDEFFNALTILMRNNGVEI